MKILGRVVIAFAVLATSSARAERRSFGGDSSYVSNGKFGLGLELGEPTGLNGKWFFAPSRALNFGVGAIYRNFYVEGDGFHTYLDHLWHPTQLANNAHFKLPFYVGVGGRLWVLSYRCPGGCNNAVLFGVRVPLGLAFDFNKIPLDVFGQITPTLDFYHNYRNRTLYLGFDFSVGIRYWFD